MKVYKTERFDFIDWVCAKTEAEAKEFHAKKTGLDVDQFVEVNTQNERIWVELDSIDDLPDEYRPLNLKKVHGVWCVQLSFDEVIWFDSLMYDTQKPYMIATTQW